MMEVCVMMCVCVDGSEVCKRSEMAGNLLVFGLAFALGGCVFVFALVCVFVFGATVQ